MHSIWKVKEPDTGLSEGLASELKIPLLVAQLLVNRGISDAGAAREFLYPDIAGLHPPSKMRGISDAVDRIRKAIDSGEKIWIYGDYDVDGITAVSLLISCLRFLGAEVDYYIPHRLDEGYGLSKDGVAELKEKGCSLMITVDCGIGAAEEVRMANEAGMDVIITDHHQPRDEVPPALVTLDPKLEGFGYPFDGLAGVGVAFKLAQALMGDEDGKNEEFLLSQLDLVALGTIADVVPLVGENRIIAKYGLEVLNRMERIGIRALCEVSEVEAGSIQSWTVGFRLGPRINAAGRIDTAHCAVELLTTDSYDEALEIAQKLDAANKERQNIERAIVNEAREQLKQFDLSREKGLVLAKEGWHPGVVGIVASKIQERYYRPTVVISIEGDEGRGSARSIPEFNIFNALEKSAHLLEKFGGHKAAAGLSIAKDNIPKFRKEFSRIVSETLSPEDLKPKVVIDLETTMRELTLDTVEKLELLEPYGQGNPQPLVSLTNLSLKGLPRKMGKTGSHLQMTVSDGDSMLRSIAFGKGEMERELEEEGITLDLAFRPYVNEWNGSKAVELRTEDIIIHRSDGPSISVGSAEIIELSQLKIVDRRGIPEKKRYLQRVLTRGEKTLLYVRDNAAVDQLQNILSDAVPETRLGLCYLGGSDSEVDQVKTMLMQGDVDAVASCVPFEEPLPGLKHVVFCHPVPTRDSFVRCCAPAVEAEELVYVHLIFNSTDVDVLTASLSYRYPDRETLVNVYKKLREMLNEREEENVLIEEISNSMEMNGPKEEIITSCMSVFGEVELVVQTQIDGKVAVSLAPTPEKRRDLSDSEHYATGDKLKQEWAKFSSFLLKKKAEDFHKMLLEMIP